MHISYDLTFKRESVPQRGNYPFIFAQEGARACSYAGDPEPSLYLHHRLNDVLEQPGDWHHIDGGPQITVKPRGQAARPAQPIFGPSLKTFPHLYEWPASQFRPTSLRLTPRQTGCSESVRIPPSICPSLSSSLLSSFDPDHVVGPTPLSAGSTDCTIAPRPWSQKQPETFLHYPPQSSLIPCSFRLRNTSSLEARQPQFHSPHRHKHLEASINAGDLVIPSWSPEQSESLPASAEAHIKPESGAKGLGIEAWISTPKTASFYGSSETRGNMDVLDLVHEDMTAEERPAICRYNPLHPDYLARVLAGDISDSVQCTKRFTRKSDCARHERIHTNDRPYICPVSSCSKRFIQKSALTVHLRTHTGERPHPCLMCDKTFADSSSLARHRKIHSGSRPYVCTAPGCTKSFCRKITLSKHIHAWHSRSERSARLSFDLTSGSSHSSPREYKCNPDNDELESDTEIVLEAPPSPLPFHKIPSFQPDTLSIPKSGFKTHSVSASTYPPYWVQPLSSLPAQKPKISRSRMTREPAFAPLLETNGPTNYRFPIRRASTSEFDIKPILTHTTDTEGISSWSVKHSESVTKTS